jgi:hypothetical protein
MTVCEEMVKGVIRAREYAYLWVRWMLNDEGGLSNGFRSLKCSMECDGFLPAPAPVTPDKTLELLTSTDLCNTVENLSKSTAAHAALYAWMINESGDGFGDEFKRALCAIECPTTSTTTTESGGTTTTTTTTTTSTSTTTSGTTLPPWNVVEEQRRWIDIAVDGTGTNMVAVVEYGKIYVSNDGGDNWTPKDSDRQYRACTISEDGTKMFAVTFTGEFLRSTDSGANWTSGASLTGDEFYSIDCTDDADRVYVSGYSISDTKGTVWVSFNNGTSWSVYFSQTGGFKPHSVACNQSGSRVYIANGCTGPSGALKIVIGGIDSGTQPLPDTAGRTLNKCSCDKGSGMVVMFGEGATGRTYASPNGGITVVQNYSAGTTINDVAVSRDGFVYAIASGDLDTLGFLFLNSTGNQDQLRIWQAVSLDETGCNNVAINFVSPGLNELRRHNC